MRQKRQHLRPGEVSLEVHCLRDGTLDVNVDNGEVFGFHRGEWRKKRLTKDGDGYLMFWLNREREHKRGNPIREKRRTKDGYKDRLRYRRRRCVLVHRLVKIKAIAVAKGGDNWRKYAADLPAGVDVNHCGPKHVNGNSQLELSTERANRSRTEMVDEELEAMRAAF